MNRDFSQKAPLQNQANMLASKGRFGDSMLVHMNPTEVDVLRRMTPGGQLTINPDTGQPEAFLPLLLGLAGSLAGGAGLLGGSALLGSVGAGALGTAIGSTIETGSLKEGLKAGLISGVLGGVAGKLFQGADTVASAGAKAGEEAVKQTVPEVVAGGGINPFAGAPSTQAVASAAPAASSGAFMGMGSFPAVNQAVVPEVATAAVEEAVKPSFVKQMLQGGIPGDAAAGIEQIGNLDPLGNVTAGAVSGLTGQTLSDQFNMMNMDSGPMLDEDDEDFFVPVQARDRGVQFAGADIGGTGEFDYFSEPFGFDPLPPVGVKEGGMISGAARTFQEGGQVEEPAPRRSDYGGSIRQQQAYNRAVEDYEDMFGPISGAIGNPSASLFRPSVDIPDYFRGPNSVGTNLDDMITEQVTEQIYTPRAQQMPSTSVSNIRGAGNVDFVDYNQRLLGDPTQTRDVTRRMTEDEIATRDAELAVMQAEEAANAPAAFQPDVQFNPLDFMSEGMGGGFNFNPFTGRADPYAAARAAGRTNATPTADTPSYVGMMGNTIDPYQNMLDRQAQTPARSTNVVGYGGDGMGMMGMPAFDPSMPAMDFGVPLNTGIQSTPNPSSRIEGGFFGNAIYPGDAGYEAALAEAGPVSGGGLFSGTRSSPLSGQPNNRGTGFLGFGGMGGMSMGM